MSERVVITGASHGTGSVNGVSSNSPTNSVHNISNVHSDDPNANVLMPVVRHMNNLYHSWKSLMETHFAIADSSDDFEAKSLLTVMILKSA